MKNLREIEAVALEIAFLSKKLEEADQRLKRLQTQRKLYCSFVENAKYDDGDEIVAAFLDYRDAKKHVAKLEKARLENIKLLDYEYELLVKKCDDDDSVDDGSDDDFDKLFDIEYKLDNARSTSYSVHKMEMEKIEPSLIIQMFLYNRNRNIIITFLGLYKFRKTVLNINNRDAISMIAKMIWDSRMKYL